VGRPVGVPGEIFDAALRIYLGRRRLDMRALAAELGIGRSTLYRKVASRDVLLGEVIWYLTRLVIATALEETGNLRGAERVVRVVDRFMHTANAAPDLRRLLEEEPEAALRILTSKHGPVQQGMIDAVGRLLDVERERGDLTTAIDPATLAYIIVRIGESFLYADVIADNEPDVDLAVDIIGKLY